MEKSLTAAWYRLQIVKAQGPNRPKDYLVSAMKSFSHSLWTPAHVCRACRRKLWSINALLGNKESRGARSLGQEGHLPPGFWILYRQFKVILAYFWIMKIHFGL